MRPTAMRTDENYIRYYNTYGRIMVTVVIPFIALTIFNFVIWKAVKRRRRDVGNGIGENFG